MSYQNVGKVWTPDSFGEYLKTIKPPTWAKGVCLHHAWQPSLSQRPQGLQIRHIENMRSFYQGMGWSRGPHLFCDEDQVFGMTPLSETGNHAIPFNSSTIGIEALGNYSKGGEDPKSGRGLQVWQTMASTTKLILEWMNLKATEKTVLFHREGKTSKDCPGAQIDKKWVLSLINQLPITNTPIIPPQEDIKMVKQFVPVAETLRKKGYSDADIKKNLRREGKNFFWLDDHLEFAYYDNKLGATIAPLSELNNIPSK